MMAELIDTYVLVKVTHTKPLPDLTDAVAGRAYTLDGVEGAVACLLQGGEHLSAFADRDRWVADKKVSA